MDEKKVQNEQVIGKREDALFFTFFGIAEAEY